MAHRTLRRHHAAVGLPEGFGVLDHGDASDLMDLVRSDLGLVSKSVGSPRKINARGALLRARQYGVPFREVMASGR